MLGECSFRLRHPNVNIFSSTIISGDLGPDSVAQTYVLSTEVQWDVLPGPSSCCRRMRLLCPMSYLQTLWSCHRLPQSTSCLWVGSRIPLRENAVSEAWRAALKQALSGCSAPFGLSRCCYWGLCSVASIDRIILCYLRSCSFSCSASKCSCRKSCHCQVLC